MKHRLALVPVAALSVLSTAALAAPAAKVCNTITDAKGDTFAIRYQDAPPGGLPLPRGPQEDGFDILTADLASDGKVVTAVIRVAKLSRTIQTSPQGATFGIDFIIGSSPDVVRLQANLITNQPDRFEVAAKAGDAIPNTPMTYVGAATGVVDAAKNEIRIHAPVALLAKYGAVKKGVKLNPNGPESATAARGVPAVTTTPGQPMSSRGPFADVAIAGKSYTVGTLSCVIPGK